MNAIEDLIFRFHGHKCIVKGVKMSDNFAKISSLLNDLENDINIIQFDKISQKEMISITKDIFSFFKLHKIAYVELTTIEQQLKKFDEDALISDPFAANKLLRLLNQIAMENMIDPFELPIELIDDSMKSCLVETLYPMLDNENFLSKSIVPFSKVRIGKDITKFTPVFYGHELVHSQLDSNKGVQKFFMNREVIPIFLEKIFSIELGHLYYVNIEKIRLSNFSSSIKKVNNNQGDLGTYTYIRSTISANILFNIYIESNSQDREEMLDGIQLIFDNKITVEDYLKKYNAIYNDSEENVYIVKKILKKIT